MNRLIKKQTHQEHSSLRTDAAIDGLCAGPLVQTRAGPQTRSRGEDQGARALCNLRAGMISTVPHPMSTHTTEREKHTARVKNILCDYQFTETYLMLSRSIAQDINSRRMGCK